MAHEENEKKNADHNPGSIQSILTVFWVIVITVIVIVITAPKAPTMGGIGRL